MKRMAWIILAMVFAHCMAIPVAEDSVSDLYFATESKIVTLTPSTSMTWTTLGAPVQVKFNNPMDASTVTINTNDTTCSGSIQITTAAADFANCLQFSSLSAQTRNSVFSAALTAELDPNSDYIIKIGGTIADFRGKTLGSDATYPFKSGIPSGAEPRVVSVTPVPASNLNLTVVFSRAMSPGIFGTPVEDVCTSNLNLQLDAGLCNHGYRSISTADNITFTLQYKNPGSGSLKLTIQKDILDKLGIPMAADYVTTLTN